MDELREAGVRWPTNPADRKPRYPLTGGGETGQGTLDVR